MKGKIRVTPTERVKRNRELDQKRSGELKKQFAARFEGNVPKTAPVTSYLFFDYILKEREEVLERIRSRPGSNLNRWLVAELDAGTALTTLKADLNSDKLSLRNQRAKLLIALCIKPKSSIVDVYEELHSLGAVRLSLRDLST
jgi:hypothetical protein